MKDEKVKVLKFERFAKKDFEEYRLWFLNETINKALYGVDDEWLTYVLNDQTGMEYAVFLENEMIAVVGLDLPKENNPAYAITNIAIKPSRFRQGIGTLVLKELSKKHPLKVGEFWMAFVDSKNELAQKFFKKNGWFQIRDTDDDDLIRFEKRN